MELATQTVQDLDISAEGEVLRYRYGSARPVEVMVRVDLGTVSRPIAGGGPYLLNTYINDVALSPVSSVAVPSGRTRTIMISRQVPLGAGDTLVVTVTGLPADTAVNATTVVRDATPITSGDVLGSGSIPVDHNYGGSGELTFQTPVGAGIAGASVVCYSAADYDAGRRSADFVAGRTVTSQDGGWESPVMLEAGHYVLVFSKPGIQTSLVRLTVS